MPAQLGSGHFEALHWIAAGDGFVDLRRQMIADLLDHPGVKRADLSALQSEIDCRRAISASPQQSVEEMMALLEQRIADLWLLSERLVQQVAAPD